MVELDKQEMAKVFLNPVTLKLKKIDFRISRELIDLVEVDIEQIIVSNVFAYW